MDGKVVIIDYDHFMERFVPPPPGQSKPRKTRYSAIRLQDLPLKPESAMYPDLMEKLNVSWLAPGYRFVETPSKPDKIASKLRVDGGMYPAADAPEENKNTDWSTIEVFIECKTDDTRGDPFDDTADDGQAYSDERRSVFGQILSYSYSIFKEQHRTHLFNVVIFGSHARISRLDRGGIVATKKFNYKTEPEKLLEFFWRFARLSAAQRGHDVSAVPVTEGSEEYRLMRSRADNPRYVGDFAFQEHARVAFEKSLRGSRWWKLKVDDESDPSSAPKARYFLVGGPHFAATRGIVGRTTRGFVAIDLNDPEGPFVYLKDAWRVAHEGIRKEGEILGYLNREGVHNIPTRICHGDVLPSSFQSSISHELWMEKHSNSEEQACPLKVHRHYRLVVVEVCLPMSDFQNGKELVRLIARCIAAHGSAFKKGIMHRDISAGNVLIHIRESVDEGGQFQSKREGFLTDWELSKDVREKPEGKGPRQPDRTGTWQFLSANVLANPSKGVELQDEMESFFHVLLYYAIRYLPTDCPDITPLMYDYFDGYTRLGEEYSASASKSRVMVEGELVFASQYYLQFLTRLPVEGQPAPPPHPINRRFVKLLKLFKAQYALYTLEAKAGHTDIDPPAGTSSALPTDMFRSSTGDKYDDDDLALVSEIEGQPEFAASRILPDPFRQNRQELEEVAAVLKSHNQMVLLFLKPFTAEGNDWPVEDKLPDQMRAGYDPLKDLKKPKPSKSGEESQERAPLIPIRIPPRLMVASNSSRKRPTLHDDDTFDNPSPKRSATDR
ncbi:hypothetical protein PYCCODRAFT_709014 [Trametes coccinea BRFM310]|uniref:Fungal-type protein kinase domain-containing protein n=1 Tax=Trametes coccinea (strain BRFM310) TaxID=1353009 RepID=A0A1Y2IGC0_TRAC3|nr:hypothetical protein PYCCODRAFT_709014 [Trametes coccinea BRFM310]